MSNVITLKRYIYPKGCLCAIWRTNPWVSGCSGNENVVTDVKTDERTATARHPRRRHHRRPKFAWRRTKSNELHGTFTRGVFRAEEQTWCWGWSWFSTDLHETVNRGVSRTKEQSYNFLGWSGLRFGFRIRFTIINFGGLLQSLTDCLASV